MAISRFKTSTLAQGLPKFQDLWDGTSAVFDSDYELIERVNVGASAVSNITFSSIPSTYKHLQIRASVKTDRSDTETTFTLRLNSDSGNNYSYHRLIGDGSSASSSGGGAGPFIYLYSGAAGNGGNYFGLSAWDILDYTNTNKNTTVRYLGGHDTNGAGRVTLGSGAWYNTSAVSTIQINTDGGFNFTQYSSFALYGIKGVS
jgi:hypothetical protein